MDHTHGRGALMRLAWLALLALFTTVMGVVDVATGAGLSLGDRVAFFGWGWTNAAGGLCLLGTAAGAWSALSRAPLTRLQMVSIAAAVGWLWLTSLAVATDPEVSGAYALQITAAIGVGGVCYGLAKQAGERFERALLGAWVVSALLYALCVGWWVTVVKDQTSYAWVQRVPGFYNLRPAAYGWELALAIGLGGLVASPHWRGVRLLVVRAGLVALWALLFWSGGRAHAVALFASAAVMAACAPAMAKRLALEVGLSAGLGALWSLTWWTPADGSFGLWNAVGRTLEGGDFNAISSGRWVLWQDVWKLFVEQPWWGHGMGQYQVWTRVGMEGTFHAHNWVLDALFSWGLLGGLTWFTGVVWVARMAWSRVQQVPSATRVAAAWGLCTLLVHGLFSGTLFYAHSQLMLATLVGLLAAESSSSRDFA